MFPLFLLLTEVATEPLTTSNTMDFTVLFLKMMAALILVCVGVVVLMKYIVPQMGIYRRMKEGRNISVVERFVLEPKRHLYIVKAGEKHLLLGVTDRKISLICELNGFAEER